MKRLFFAFALVLSACNLSDPGTGVQVGTNNNASDSGNNASTNNAATDAGDLDAGGEMDACTPNTCSDTDCGMLDDGCGGMLDCGVCSCTADNFETFCPDMPCMEAVGCTNEQCDYAPTSCNGFACECAAEECTEDELRWCRDSAALTCPADACDPQPTANDDGTMSFGNACVQPDGASCDYVDICTAGVCAGTSCVPADCGTCNLGRWDCVGTEQTCFEAPDIGLVEAEINCNDQQATSTFIYVDHVAGTDANGSGSRAQPFATLPAAYAAAEQRGARALVVREGYTLNEPLQLRNGISILGGYSGAPEWTNVDGRISIFAPNPAPVAVNAQGIDLPTMLHNVDIDTDNPGGPVHTVYGVRAINSPGLILSNVYVRSARGLDGSAGRVGSTGRGGANGAPPSGPSGAAGGVNVGCPAANAGTGGNGGTRFAEAGRPGSSSNLGAAGGVGGPPGAPGGTGTRGTTIRVSLGSPGSPGQYSFSIENGFWVPNGQGGDGGTGGHGSGGGGGGGGGGSTNSISFGFGGGGGGGGAGGCGGGGGIGGQPGGSAFGLFAIDSTGLQTIDDSTFIGGTAGNGGDGGIGGVGGTPGQGNAGSPPSGQAGPGGPGGDGGPGGRGGQGGGGAGGSSIAVHCINTQLDLTSPTLELIANPAGTGGQGGATGEPGVSAESLGCD